MGEIEKIDEEELFKQRIEELKKGRHISVEIVIGDLRKDGNYCTPHIEANGVSIKEIAAMIQTLKETASELEDRYPMAGLFTSFISTKRDGIIETNKEE